MTERQKVIGELVNIVVEGDYLIFGNANNFTPKLSFVSKIALKKIPKIITCHSLNIIFLFYEESKI